MKLLFILLGTLSLIVGIIGIFLPVMPTVPFLLAALALGSDSPRLKKFLDNNPVCKYYLEKFREKRPLSQYLKYASLTGLWLSVIITFWATDNVFLKIFITGVAIALTLLLITLKSSRH